MPPTLRSVFERLRSDDNYREILGNSAANLAIRIIGIVVGYLFIYLISKYYGAEVLGLYTLSVTVMMMFTVVGRMGMDLAMVKHIAAAREDDATGRIKEVFRKSLFLLIPVGVILSLLLYVSAGFISEEIFRKPQLTSYLKVMSVAVLPMMMRFFVSECYRGFKMIRSFAFSQNVGYFLFACILLAVLTFTDRSFLNPNIAFAASLIFLMFTGLFHVRGIVNRDARPATSEWRIKGLFSFAFPMMLTGSLFLISGWMITLILGSFVTEAEVGIYSAALKVATLSSFILLSINSIVAPRFAQLHAAGDNDGLKRYAGQTARVVFLTSLPVAVLIALFRVQILGLFGEGFAEGSTVLLILMIGQFFNFFAGSVGHFLNMTGNQKVMRNIVSLSALMNMALCFMLIPEFGITGAAVCNTLFMATWNIIAMLYIKGKFGVRTYFWPSSGRS